MWLEVQKGWIFAPAWLSMIYRLISKQLWFRKQLHALNEGAFRKIEQIKVFVCVIHDYISVWCNGNVSRFTLQEWQLYWTEMLLLTCCPFKHKDSWKEPFRRQLERIITEAIQPVCFCSEMKRKMLPSEIAVTWNQIEWQCLLKMFPVNLLGMIKLIKMASLIIISWSGSRMDLTTTKVVVLLLLGLTKIVFGLAPLVLTRFFLKNGLRIK